MIVSGRVWAAGTAGLVVVIAAGTVLLGVQPQLARAAAADATTASTQTQTSAARIRLAVLAKVAAQQSELQSQEVKLAKAVPTGLQVNTFYRRMNELAALDGVSLDTVTQGAATSYTPPAGTAAATPVPTATATPAPSASATAAAVAATPTAPVLAATDPLITAATLSVVPTTVRVLGTPDAAMQFVKDVQTDERLFLVSGIDTETDPTTPGTSSTTLTGSVYVLAG